MSETKKATGGPAFPHEAPDWAACPRCNTSVARAGMTIRDYFAAKAMQGLLAGGVDFAGEGAASSWVYQADKAIEWNAMACHSPTHLARLAVEAADALIAELNK